MNRSIAVIGAGNGALAVAGAAALAGHRVTLWDRYLDDHPELIASSSITLTGRIEGIGHIQRPIDDLAATIEDAELIEVVVPGFALAWVTSTLLPLVRPGQKVLLHPGGSGGTLEVAHLWRDAESERGVVLGVTDTLAYAARASGPTQVHIHAEKRYLMVSAIDPRATEGLLSVVADVHPQAHAAASTMEVALANLNPVIHPPIALLNAGRIDAGHTFSLYGEGVGMSVGSLIDALDRERMTLAAGLDVAAISLHDWVERAYGVRAGSTTALFAELDVQVYGGLLAPTSMDSRYLTEDIPLGLAVIVELAAEAGIDVPVTESVVRLARVVLNRVTADV
jgi:opine dehydrogenase